MTLRFLAIDPDTNGENCPALFLSAAASLKVSARRRSRLLIPSSDHRGKRAARPPESRPLAGRGGTGQSGTFRAPNNP
jgi:hypothetical protein